MTARARPNIIDKILWVIDRALLVGVCDVDIDEWTLIPASHERLALARFFEYSIVVTITPQVIIRHMDHPATDSDSYNPCTYQHADGTNESLFAVITHQIKIM